MFAKKNKPTFTLLFALGATLMLAEAITSYAQSSYLGLYFGLSQIALIIALATFITLIWTSYHPGLIIKHGNYNNAVVSGVIILATHIVLAYFHQPWLIIVAFVFRYACLALLFVNIDLALESISKDNETGSIRTKYLTIINLSFLISPFLTSKIVGVDHFQRVYSVGMIIVTILLFLILWNRRRLDQHLLFAVKQSRWLSSLKLMMANRNLGPVFISALSLQMFFCLAVLYVPIYLNKTMGIAWSDLGWMFTVMLLPFVLLQFPAGYIADKFIGEKEMLIAGQIILALTTAIIFLTTSNSTWLWAWLLLASRVGAALSEAMQEVYFYKQVNVSDLGLINLYRQTKTIGWLIGTCLAAVILFFFPIPYLFIFLSGLFIINALWLRGIVDTK